MGCVVLSTKTTRQPWALEMLVKVLKQVMTSKNTSTMFRSACHADMKNILPDMAQLQWTLHGNAGIKMISSCPSCQYLAVLTLSGLVFVVNQDGFVTQMKYQENDLKGLVWSINEDRDEKITHH